MGHVASSSPREGAGIAQGREGGVSRRLRAVWALAALIVVAALVATVAWAQDGTATPPPPVVGTLPEYLQVGVLAYLGGQIKRSVDDLARTLDSAVTVGRELTRVLDLGIQAGASHARAIDVSLTQLTRSVVACADAPPPG